MKRIVESLATGFYFGKIPFAPGTWGTIWGIPLAYGLLRLGTVTYMVSTIFLILFASVIAELHERNTLAHDPGEIVIDEVVGYLVAMTMLPDTWQSYIAAFVAFRVFDIWKPLFIRRIDQRIKGGLGTVLDDVAAGLAANVCLQLIAAQTTWLSAAHRG